jgi:hypothetical protein
VTAPAKSRVGYPEWSPGPDAPSGPLAAGLQDIASRVSREALLLSSETSQPGGGWLTSRTSSRPNASCMVFSAVALPCHGKPPTPQAFLLAGGPLRQPDTFRRPVAPVGFTVAFGLPQGPVKAIPAVRLAGPYDRETRERISGGPIVPQPSSTHQSPNLRNLREGALRRPGGTAGPSCGTSRAFGESRTHCTGISGHRDTVGESRGSRLDAVDRAAPCRDKRRRRGDKASVLRKTGTPSVRPSIRSGSSGQAR